MNLKLLVIYCFLTTTLFGQKEENPFLNLSADSVVFYDFGGPHELYSIIDSDGRISTSVTKHVKLDQTTANSFSTKLTSNKSFGGNVAACFEPHLGVIYYKNKKRVAHLDICLSCNRLNSSIHLKAQDQGRQTTDEGEVYYTLHGMSKQFRKEINILLKKYNFSHQAKSNSMFDE